jgi:hypothetical protein
LQQKHATVLDQIKNHLMELIQPLQNAKMSVRFGFLGYSATSKSKLSIAYSMVFLGGDDTTVEKCSGD